VTTIELLRRIEETVTKQLDQVRREMAKIDPKDNERRQQLQREAEVLQNCLVYASCSLLTAGLK
jgi:hypothetical protein